MQVRQSRATTLRRPAEANPDWGEPGFFPRFMRGVLVDLSLWGRGICIGDENCRLILGAVFRMMKETAVSLTRFRGCGISR